MKENALIKYLKDMEQCQVQLHKEYKKLSQKYDELSKKIDKLMQEKK